MFQGSSKVIGLLLSGPILLAAGPAWPSEEFFSPENIRKLRDAVRDRKIVVVHREGKGDLEGKLIEVDQADRTITLSLGGSLEIKWAEIRSVDIKGTPADLFQGKWKECKEFAARKSTSRKAAAARFFDLADWCGRRDVALPEKREQALEEVIRIDPEHEQARDLLGYVKASTGWMTKQEFKEKYKLEEALPGLWVEPEEAERIRRRRFIGNYSLKSGIPWAQAKPLEGTYFILTSNAAPKVAERYHLALEAFAEKLTELLAPGKKPPAKRQAFVYKDKAEFDQYVMPMRREMLGIYNLSEKGLRLFDGPGCLETLAHEGTHAIQGLIFPEMVPEMNRIPICMIEGMAAYYGDGTAIKFRGKFVEISMDGIPRAHLQGLKLLIRAKAYVPLRYLLRLPPSGFLEYLEGWGIIFWCLQGEEHEKHGGAIGPPGAGRRVWESYVKGLVAGKRMDFVDLLEKGTGLRAEAWEERYKKFISNMPLSSRGAWTSNVWDGTKEVGISIKFPSGSKGIDDDDLRAWVEEAAAVKGEVRFWLGVRDYPEGTLEEFLADTVKEGFEDIEDIQDLDDDPGEIVLPKDIKIPVASFEGTFNKERESRFRGSEKRAADGAGGFDPAARHHFRIAAIPGYERYYLICMAGPKDAFLKELKAFDETVKSARVGPAR